MCLYIVHRHFLKSLFRILRHIILFQFIYNDVYPLIHQLCPELFCHSTNSFRILNQANLLPALKVKIILQKCDYNGQMYSNLKFEPL
jgi:hypothetical protein